MESVQLNRKRSSIDSGRDDKVLEEIKFDARRVSSSTSLTKLPEIYESYELTNEVKEPRSIKNNGSSGNASAVAESELLDNVFDDDVKAIVYNDNGSRRVTTPENDYVEIDAINGSAPLNNHNNAHHSNVVKWYSLEIINLIWVCDV